MLDVYFFSTYPSFTQIFFPILHNSSNPTGKCFSNCKMYVFSKLRQIKHYFNKTFYHTLFQLSNCLVKIRIRIFRIFDLTLSRLGPFFIFFFFFFIALQFAVVLFIFETDIEIDCSFFVQPQHIF